MNDGLKDQQRNAILEVLNQHPKIERAVLFGSRAMGTFTPTSDIDIALYGDLTLRDQARIADELERLSIPYTVDLVRMKTVTSSEMLAHIKGHGREWKQAQANVALSESVQLRDVCLKIGSGATPRGGKEAYKGGGTSLIRSQNVYNEGFHRDGLVYIDDTQSAELKNVEVKADDVLLNITGDSVARCCQVAADVLPARVNQHVAIIRPQPELLDARFLRYVLVSREYQQRLLALASAGATRPALTKAMIEDLDIPSPPLAEQKAIAAVLGALDAKIELNRRMNATLEAMARALFQSWFVDFDPVRAKLDGEGFNSPSLDPATAALFPDSLQDSELGHIPKGWEVIPLYDTAQWVNGAAFKNEDFCAAGEGLPVIKIAELKDGISSQTKWCQRDAAPDKIIDTGDLVYSWSGSPDTSLEAFLWSGRRGLLNQHIFKVISATKAEKRFVYYLLQYLRPVLVETARNKQTTGLGHVTIADMKRLLVCMPGKEVLAAFDQIVAPIFDKAFTNTLESRSLATLRDTLLPKLLSGELSIGDMEKEVST